MRKRSETIFAETEEEYKEMLEAIDLRDSKRSKKIKKTLIDEISEDLSGFTNYQLSQITKIQQTIREREMLDEGKLLETIEEMNKNYQNFHLLSVKEDSDSSEGSVEYELTLEEKTTSSHSELAEAHVPVWDKQSLRNRTLCDLLETEKDQNKNLNFLANWHSPALSKESITISTGENTEENGSLEMLINQNLVNYEEIIKLIVVGDRCVGKSLFVQRLISTENENEDLKVYTPTESLEIKKTFFQIYHKNIKVEAWDTNLSVVNSALIKTYYKITNGYVIIADYDRVETLSFAEKQIEIIIDFSHFIDNIFLIINKKFDGHNKTNNFVEKKINAIYEKFNIKGIISDLSTFTKCEQSFEKYFHTVYYNKTGKINTFENKEHNLISSAHCSLTKSHSSRKSKQFSPQLNNMQIDHRISNRDQVHVNISQKRNSGIKRDLNEIFRKLNMKVATDEIE